MTAIKSQVNSRSAEFRANAERMRNLVSDLREKISTSKGRHALGKGK